jgi:hypothetical protein
MAHEFGTLVPFWGVAGEVTANRSPRAQTIIIFT